MLIDQLALHRLTFLLLLLWWVGRVWVQVSGGGGTLSVNSFRYMLHLVFKLHSNKRTDIQGISLPRMTGEFVTGEVAVLIVMALQIS
jgi:hypothetical protein